MKKATKSIMAGVLAITMLACLSACKKESEDVVGNTQMPETQQVQTPVNQLTGMTDISTSSVGKRPIAVVINNQPQARPQWGLNSADAIFEFPVEGMITRMMWLYGDYDKLPEKIGPLRSARHHFVYTAGALDAIYIHWGGSTLGYQAIKDNNIDDIDAMKYGDGAGKYFYRDKTRSTAIEHRGITDGDNLREVIELAIDRQSLKKDSVGAPFLFSQETVAGADSCTRLSISFSSGFNRVFQYDADERLYYNSMNGEPFRDGNDGKQNAVSNIFVLYASVSTLSNELVDVDLTGGTGIYITNGTSQKVKWSKGNNATSKLEITYEDGTPVKMNTGKTWFNFVPDNQQNKTVIG